MNKLDKAGAMKCFGDFTQNVELDPDPNAQDKLQEEFNCKNCECYEYCRILEDTLKG